MSNPLVPKKSVTPGAVPTSGQLLTGELAANLADGLLFIKKADGIIVSIGQYTLPVSSSTVLGGVKIGAGISIDANGVISASAGYTLPVATGSVLGGVKQGAGVAIAADGTLSAAQEVVSVATTSALPATGATGALYLTTDTAKTYLWNGSVYYEAGPDTNYVNTLGALYTRRSDVVGDTSYIGKAAFGSATSASVWTIRKTVYTSAGAVSSTTTATNVKWDDRLTATYS